MTEQTSPKPAIDINKVKNKLLQQKNQITHLETEVVRLQEELVQNQADQHRIATESQLAADDSELARSFNQKNYAPVIRALFEQPSKQLRNGAFFILLFFVAAALAAGYLSAGYLTYTHNIIIDNKLDSLRDQVVTLTKLQQLQQEVTNKSLALTELEIKNRFSPAINTSTSISAIAKNTHTINEPKTNVQKTNQIAEQASAILRYVRTAEKQEGFLKNYTRDKTQFSQLYLIVMQYASNQNIYYESYLEVIKSLKISPDIAPKTIDDLLRIDLEFLQAAYSGLLITSHKKTRGWRYREADQQFSSYYNSNLNYNLGSWQIVNDSQDYKTLPNIFALNIDRVKQQVIFNGSEEKLQLPEKIYYSAYSETKKNAAIKKLLNQEIILNENGALTIDASIINLPLSNDIQKKLAQQLVSNGISLAGDSLTTAVNKYRASKDMSEDGIVDLKLLNNFNLYPTYKSLQLP